MTSQSSKAKTNGQSATYGKDKGCDYDPERDRWDQQTSNAELHLLEAQVSRQPVTRRHVISLNIHRRHLNRLQLAILCEEIYGKKADEIAAEALRQGRIKGNQNRSPSRPISVSTGGPEQKVKRNEIVADLAKQDGINVTRYAIAGIQPAVRKI